jgi:fibronectin-binding autotransporter adhesin
MPRMPTIKLSRSSPRGQWSTSTSLLIAAVLVTVANVAYAGFSESGMNFPEPVMNGTTQQYFIGSAGVGTLTINNAPPSTFTAGGLSAGTGGTGNGTITIDGSGTTVTLSPVGSTNILGPGSWGTGLVTISGGAVVDGTNGAGCTGGSCFSAVANGAGSTGTLNITGTGSTLSLAGEFVVGQDSVLQNTTTGSVFGTPGGASSGTLNITSGGILNTQANIIIGQNSNVGTPPAGSINVANGTETAIGTATVSGSGSTWNSSASVVLIGLGPNATGSLSIASGASVNLGVTTPATAIEIGGDPSVAGGTGSLTVNAGSLSFAGTDNGIHVGRNQGSGVMTVEAGGTVSGGLFTDVGRDGSTGSLTVNGLGSSLTLSGANATMGAFLGVGVVDTPALGTTLGPSTSGTVTIENGGKITVDTDNNLNGGMNVGQNGGTGNLTITGAGSQLVISGNNSNTNTGGGASVGRSGNGTLNVLAGGQFTIDNTGTTAGSGFTIGGSPEQVTAGEQAGTGTVTVSGTGSQINLLSAYGTMTVGYTGTGTLNVLNGGTVVSEDVLAIGRSTGSTGLVSIDGTGSSFTLSGNDVSNGEGARIQVGASGTGILSLANGAQLLINPTTTNGGVIIGGTGTLTGGVGTMTVSGGSQALISGTDNLLIVGRNGTGSLTITGGSTVDVAYGAGSTGQTFVGAIPASFSSTSPLSGILTIANGSTLNAGSLLGIASNGVASSSGSGAVLLSGGSTINATNSVIGTNGLLAVADPAGRINGNVMNNGGTISPGAPPGSLQINGNFAQTGGNIDLEIDSDGHGGFVTDKLVLENGSDFGTTGATISFHFLDDADPNAFAADGLFNLDTFFGFANADGTDEVPLSSEISGMLDTVFVDDTYVATADSFNITSFGFDPNTGVTELVATPTPEPSSVGLLTTALLGFFGLGYVRRRSRPN